MTAAAGLRGVAAPLLGAVAPLRPLVVASALFAAGAWAWGSGGLPALLLYREDVAYLMGQHVALVAWAGGLAILAGIPVGALLSRPRFERVADGAMQIFNLGTTVPTLAVLALAMTWLGIGTRPAVFGLWVATLLPIVRNTHAGLRAVDPALIEAGRGMGMTARQLFLRVELPNALFVIFAGIRTALAICVGTAPLAFLIGAGGLGELIFTGIALDDLAMMLAGAIPTALLAVATDFLVARVQYLAVPRGVNPLRD